MEASIAIDAGVSSLVTAAAQIAADIDNVRSDAANEMAVGNDLTALGYAGAPRTRARCHANGHATAMGGTVQGDAVPGAPTVWHPGAKIGADAQANTVFMRPGAFGAVNIAGNTQACGDIALREGTTPTQGMFYGYADGAAMRIPSSASVCARPCRKSPHGQWLGDRLPLQLQPTAGHRLM
ncbi:hypothetical protein [Xanthomonas arboricola]|uniref:hypothetical protein n=1 Tax=Xanthomonas arboricola TaxID=56448 RepID=UPI0004D572C5|nr:hypothetical protein [Xanthomonas arboricola]KER80885.1 hypothetical protein IA64_16965 [Xanthomonas arboricola pv. celebensis]